MHDPRLHKIVAAQPYPLIFATISGAHVYGFPSEDSDYDLRGAHILPPSAVMGLDVKHETIERSTIDQGLELDLDARRTQILPASAEEKWLRARTTSLAAGRSIVTRP